MADVSRFDTPGSLRDLPDDAAFYAAWHKFIKTSIVPELTGGSGGGEFFNPGRFDSDRIANRTLVWIGFPRTLLVGEHRDAREVAFKQADFSDPADPNRTGRCAQNEYLEWHVTRRRKKITKVVFTTETPEYFTQLAQAGPEGRAEVVALYRELLGRRVPQDDLFPSGTYDPDSSWNVSTGIVHYIQQINELLLAINLARGSVDSGGAVDNYDALPGPRTAADPRVALDVGAVARKGLSVTLAEPIGLYMIHWDDTGWAKPDGTPVDDYWRVTRGAPGAALRLEYEVPADEGFTVGDISIGGRPIEFGGQIAEHITVGIVGAAGRRR